MKKLFAFIFLLAVVVFCTPCFAQKEKTKIAFDENNAVDYLIECNPETLQSAPVIETIENWELVYARIFELQSSSKFGSLCVGIRVIAKKKNF